MCSHDHQRSQSNCTLHFNSIVWGDRFQLTYGEGEPVYPGVDGAIGYEVKTPEMKYRVYQPFKRGPSVDFNGRPVWGWDGNREAPTLTPSFLMDCPPQYRVHLYFTAGKVNLLGDSTVTLEE